MFRYQGHTKNLKELLIEKIDLYLTVDNPPPTTKLGKWLDKREKFRMRASQYSDEVKSTGSVILLEKVYKDYIHFTDKQSSLGSSVKLRDRIGEAFREYFNFSDDDIYRCKFVEDFPTLVIEHLNRGGTLNNVHILCIGMLVYDKIDHKLSEFISRDYTIN